MQSRIHANFARTKPDTEGVKWGKMNQGVFGTLASLQAASIRPRWE